MKRTILRTAVFTMLVLAAGSSPLRAQDVTCTWEDPCDPAIGIIGYLDCRFGFCLCQGDWWDLNNWSCNSVPDASNEIAVIQETNRNQMCPEDPSESWHRIHVNTNTFKNLEIKAGGSPGLRLAFFWGPTVQTLTVNGTVKINGVNGPVTFEVGGLAKLRTQ